MEMLSLAPLIFFAILQTVVISDPLNTSGNFSPSDASSSFPLIENCSDLFTFEFCLNFSLTGS